MNTLEDSGQTFVDAVEGVWADIVAFMPDLLAGILILIIGLILASVLGRLARRAVRFARLDNLSDDSETTNQLKQAGVDFKPSNVVGSVVKWFFIIVTLVAVSDIFGLDEVTSFLNEVILYIPHVIAAILILVIGIVIGDTLQKVVTASARASQVVPGSGVLLGRITRWAVVVFAIFAALTELGVAEALLQIVVAGVSLGAALAIGLAVGLGSQDKVREMINRGERRTEERQQPPQGNL